MTEIRAKLELNIEWPDKIAGDGIALGVGTSPQEIGRPHVITGALEHPYALLEPALVYYASASTTNHPGPLPLGGESGHDGAWHSLDGMICNTQPFVSDDFPSSLQEDMRELELFELYTRQAATIMLQNKTLELFLIALSRLNTMRDRYQAGWARVTTMATAALAQNLVPDSYLKGLDNEA